MSSGRPRSAAADRSRPASPATTSSAPKSACASMTQVSGPMPAGSPEVMTIRGRYTERLVRLELDFDEGIVPQATQPQLGFLIRLAFADGGKGALPAHVRGAVVAARTEHLRDMPAVAGLEGLADLVVLQVGDCLAEFRHERAGPRPAQVPAVGGRTRILRCG